MQKNTTAQKFINPTAITQYVFKNYGKTKTASLKTQQQKMKHNSKNKIANGNFQAPQQIKKCNSKKIKNTTAKTTMQQQNTTASKTQQLELWISFS